MTGLVLRPMVSDHITGSPSPVRTCTAPAGNAFSTFFESQNTLGFRRKENAILPLNMLTILTTATAEISWNSAENFWGEHFGAFDPVTPHLPLNTALVTRYGRVSLWLTK